MRSLLAGRRPHMSPPSANTPIPLLHFEPFKGSLDDWGTVLEQYPDRELFQTPAWMRFLAESQHARPVLAELKDGNSTVGHFAGLIVQKFGLRILGSPFIGWTTERMGIRLADGVPKCRSRSTPWPAMPSATCAAFTWSSRTCKSCRPTLPPWVSRAGFSKAMSPTSYPMKSRYSATCMPNRRTTASAGPPSWAWSWNRPPTSISPTITMHNCRKCLLAKAWRRRTAASGRCC